MGQKTAGTFLRQLFCLYRLRGLPLPGVPVRDCGGADTEDEKGLDKTFNEQMTTAWKSTSADRLGDSFEQSEKLITIIH